MHLLVWNSQGAKWDTFWTQWVAPAMAANDDLAGLLLESGWAPWVASGNVYIDATYGIDSNAMWFDAAKARVSTFCLGMTAVRGRFSLWVPWVRNHEAMKTNSRCSLGGAVIPYKMNLQSMSTFKSDLSIRPVVKFSLGPERDTKFTILLVHLKSGWSTGAKAELEELTKNMSKVIPQGTSGIIVGDMNIDLLKTPLVAPENWRILRTRVPTQCSGGELDWALLYDPNNKLAGSTAAVVQQFKHDPNGSDHSVMLYTIPI